MTLTSVELTPSQFLAGEIRAEMARKGISHREVARRLGVSQMWVGRRIGVNAVTDLTFEDLVKLAEALNVPAQGLVNLLLPRLDSNQQPSGYTYLQVNDNSKVDPWHTMTLTASSARACLQSLRRPVRSGERRGGSRPVSRRTVGQTSRPRCSTRSMRRRLGYRIEACWCPDEAPVSGRDALDEGEHRYHRAEVAPGRPVVTWADSPDRVPLVML